MIWESHPWKCDIWKTARYLEKLSIQKRHLSERQLVSIEKKILLGFYAIRKLIEANKLSDDFKAENISLQSYPRTTKPITHFNWHKLDHLFKLDRSKPETWKPINLCHQFVHSYIFNIISGDNGGLAGFFVASDKKNIQFTTN